MTDVRGRPASAAGLYVSLIVRGFTECGTTAARELWRGSVGQARECCSSGWCEVGSSRRWLIEETRASGGEMEQSGWCEDEGGPWRPSYLPLTTTAVT